MKTIKRRRREGKTNYLKRLKLLKSGKPRIVLRRTNRYFIAQCVVSKEAKDRVLVGVNSKMLLKYGWPEKMHGSLKSISAAYLTGFLLGKRIKEMETPILDFGINRNIHKGRIYAFIKGVIDAGIKVKHREETFPEEQRIQGAHMKNKIDIQKIKLKIEQEEK